jgi:hypothetical protein
LFPNYGKLTVYHQDFTGEQKINPKEVDMFKLGLWALTGLAIGLGAAIGLSYAREKCRARLREDEEEDNLEANASAEDHSGQGASGGANWLPVAGESIKIVKPQVA